MAIIKKDEKYHKKEWEIFYCETPISRAQRNEIGKLNNPTQRGYDVPGLLQKDLQKNVGGHTWDEQR
jgi:hypothetical protein